MKFGVHLPHIGPVATRDNVMRFAREAESLGFDSCWVSDHIAYPDTATLESKYPYNDTGEFQAPSQTPWLDAVGTLLFVAGCTERVQLGTTVMILGYRPAVQTAKLWSTLDAVSGGRAILGVGVAIPPAQQRKRAKKERSEAPLASQREEALGHRPRDSRAPRARPG